MPISSHEGGLHSPSISVPLPSNGGVRRRVGISSALALDTGPASELQTYQESGEPLRLNDPRTCAVFVILDALTLFLGAFSSWFIYHQLFSNKLSNWQFYAGTSAVFSLIFVVAALTNHSYSFLWGSERSETIVETFRSFVITFVLFITLLFFTHLADGFSRITFIIQFLVCGTSLLILRSVQLGILKKAAQRRLIVTSRVVLIGTQERINRLIKEWSKRDEGVSVVGSYVVPSAGEMTQAREVELKALIGAIVHKSRAETIDRFVILLPFSEQKIIDLIVKRLSELPVGILVSAETQFTWGQRPTLLRFGGFRMLRVTSKPLSITDRMIKRTFDFFVSVVLLAVLLPTFLLLAIIIRLDSPGPAIFRQRRKGFNQQQFKLFKFRTMCADADKDGFSQTKKRDVRITRVGGFLRRFNIDELPQLFNVLRGEMSLVGPRPHAVEHDNQYAYEIAAYARRHNMKPGITGLAQAYGLRGATETLQQMETRIRHDLLYIENWSFLLDIKIMLMTVFSPRAYRNAY
jgi:Undecaprenyl-phosphate glucose phosphotransferase